jgi:hypothetical protein
MDLIWTKSTFCADKMCVEVAQVDADTIALRDGKNIDQPSLLFSRRDWLSFLDSVTSESVERR